MAVEKDLIFDIPNSKYYIELAYGPVEKGVSRYMSITLRDEWCSAVVTFDTYKGNKAWLDEHFKLIMGELAQLKKCHEGFIKEIDNTANFLPVTFAKILETHKDYP